MKYLEVSFKNDWYKDKYGCHDVRTIKVSKSTDRAVNAIMVAMNGRCSDKLWIPKSQFDIIGEKTENTKSDLKND